MNLTSSETTEMLNNLTDIFFQKGTIGSTTPVTMFIFLCLDLFKTRAKYCGLGCSVAEENSVNPQRCVIVAEYRFHSSR